MGRWGDWGNGGTRRWGDKEIGRQGDRETRRWGDKEMGGQGEKEMGRWEREQDAPTTKNLITLNW